VATKTSFFVKLLAALCLFLAADAAFGATLPACNVMAGSNELCVVTTGKLTLVSGPDPLGLAGSNITTVTGVLNSTNSAWKSGWSVLGAPVNPGSSHTYSAVPLTLTSVASPLTLFCNAGATVDLNATGSGDSLNVTSCNLYAGTLNLSSTFTANINFPANTIAQALPLPFAAVPVGSNSQATYVCGIGPPLCASSDPTTLSLTNGTIQSTCVTCATMSLNPPSPGPLTFTAQQGGSAPASQTVTVSNSPATAVSYAVTASVTTPPGGTWLSVSPAGGQIGGASTSFQVSVAPGSLTPNTYTGTVTVYAPDFNGPKTETVNFTVTAPSFTLNQPGAVTFASVNSSVPASQNVSVATTPTESVPFTAVPSSTGSWLSVAPTSGTTGSTISVSADPTKAPGPGANAGTIALNATGASNNPVTVNVTFNVTTIPTPAALTFAGTAGGSNPPNQPLSVTATGPNVTYTAAASSTGNWLSVSSGTFTTNGAEPTVSVSTAGLGASGSPYSGTITITPSVGAAIHVGVTLTLTSLPTMVPGSASLSFTSSAGAVPGNQNLGITSSSGAINYTVAAATTTGGSWLQVSPASGSTPGSETVSISSSVLATLATGTYNGSITFTCTPTSSCGNTNGQVSVPVTLTVTAALSPLPTSLTFNYTIGGSTPASQGIAVTSNGGAITYTATAATTSGGAWLAVSPGSATTPAGVTASMNAGVLTGLGAGTYNGSITLTSAGASNSPVTIPASLVVSALPTLSVTGGPLTFNMVNLGSLPGAQTLNVTASGGAAIPFTTSVNTTSGGSWLAATPSGTTPGTVSVSILANNLAAGTYNGTVQVSSTGASNSPQTVNVQLVVTAAPTISANPSTLTYGYTLLSGTNPASQTVNVTASGGATIPFTAAASTTPPGGTWLSVSSNSANTPATLTVSVNTTGLAAGTYNGSISVTSAQASNSPQSVAVTLTVSPAPLLGTSSNSFTFAYQIGGSTPASESVNITSNGAALNFTAGASTTSGGSWLSVLPTSGTTPASLTVSIVPAVLTTLAAGTYNGSVTITSAQAGNSPVSLPVTLTVSALPSLTTAPSSLSFSYAINGTVPGSQAVAVGSSGSALSSVSASTATPWLSVSQNGSSTPVTLTVSLVQAGLSGLTAGTYNGSVSITATGAGNSPLSYPVTLVVSAQPVLTVTPSPLTFNGQAGGANPASQTLSVTSANGAVNFTAAPATTSGGNWLSVLPTSGTTNTTVQVSVNTSGMASGNYSGSITVTAPGASGSPAVIPVSLTLAANSLTATPSPLSFSFQLGGTAPAMQTLSVGSTVAGLSFTAASGASWLGVTPGSGTTPQGLSVSIVTTGLTAQTYNTNITLTAAGAGNSPLLVPVSLTVTSAPPLTATPNRLSFSYTQNGSMPASQAVLIAAGSTAVSFTATVATSSGGNWLAVNPPGGTTPGSIGVSVINLGSLTPGTYNGTVTATAAGSNTVAIPVTLTVNATPSLTVNPTMLSFSYTSGGAVPTPQSVAVSTSNAASAAFSLSASTASGGNWLQFSPTNGASPASFVASIVPAGLTAGTYNGVITVSAPGFTSATVAVTLAVAQPQAVIQATGSTLFILANTAAPATSTLVISASDGSAQAFTIAAGASQNNWLTLSPTSGTAPANVKLTANPAGLIPGIYVITITVTMPGLPIPSKTIEAQLTITGSNLAASPNMLTFNFQPGLPLPAPQTVSLTTVSGGGSVALASVTTNVGWITVTPASSAPVILQVSINPGLLTPGTYTGDVIVKGVGSPDASLEIPVTITIDAAPQLTATPASLAFNYQIGSPAPAPLSFALATGNVQLNFTATSPGSWLQLSPQRGATPGSVLVTVNPAGLAAGAYGGAINVTAAGAANSVAVAVTLTVTVPPPLTIAPGQLAFAAPVGGPAPAPQTLTVTSASGPLGFTAAAGSAWLGVTPAGGTTPATLAVSVNPAGLQSGTYNGTINITPAGSAVPQMVPVTLQVGGVPAPPTILGVINAASGAVGTVAPGMAISIFGTALGPQTSASFAAPPAGGTVATALAGTEVLFDGTAVPVLYTSALQVNALAPFELANKPNTVLQVVYNGVTSAGVALPVVPAEPGLFSVDATGKGQGDILNQDSTLNSASNPAAAGSAIVLFGTGGGLTLPPSTDGALNPISNTGALVLATTATVGGQPANVFYAGPAPGLVSGVFQINLTLPANTPSGNIPVIVKVGDAISQAVTVAVQ
jgi:uncharacterized protein (TIGR03437 family)